MSSESTNTLSAADIRAGLLVFLIALPLSLGIAMASGFPPVAGVITAIVGGVLASLLGSARLTIKGPAAGLIVIALGAVQELGGGDAALGYRRALAVGVVAGVVQIAFALMSVATLGIAMSPSVVHGMLAAIGVIIMSKQVHTVMGVSPEGKEPLELIAEIPHSIAHANPEILFIGGLSLALLFLCPLIPFRWAKRIPAPMLVLMVAVPLGMWFQLDAPHTYTFLEKPFVIGPQYLVHLPGNLLNALAFPDFRGVTELVSLKYVAMFALVGSIESVLSVLAVDSMDPARKGSDLNRDLLAVGIGNVVAASVGGLPMISEIVRSKANIDAGAQSKWANFSHGVALLAFVTLLPGLLHQIPLAALAAMLVYTGARLASPAELRIVGRLGRDQLALFMTTLLVTLATDLLVGVFVGLTLKVALHVARGASLAALFATQVTATQEQDTLTVTLRGAAAFPSLLKLRRIFQQMPSGTRHVHLELSHVRLVDHTFLERVEAMAAEWPDMDLVLIGLENLQSSTDHPHATRRQVRPAQLQS